MPVMIYASNERIMCVDSESVTRAWDTGDGVFFGGVFCWGGISLGLR